MVGAAITVINACKVSGCESSAWFGVFVLVIGVLAVSAVIYLIHDYYKHK